MKPLFYRHDLSMGSRAFEEALHEAGLKADEIDLMIYAGVGRDFWNRPTPISSHYPSHGNVVSASVPAGMALASEDGSLTRGDRFLTVVASAGMSFLAITGVY